MAGIYIHIPYCKQKCSYCNFHFSTNLSSKNQMLNAICRELELRKNELENEKIESIYLGGGTPSLLDLNDLEKIFSVIYQNYSLHTTPEITLEANPDDLNSKKIKEFKSTVINRFSIGIQSFFDEDLVLMNRAHSAKEAFESVKNVQNAGFTNITIDLIYGGQTTTNEMWKKNIETALKLNVPHISSYALTIEPKTLLNQQIKTKKLADIDEGKQEFQFNLLIELLTQNGFQHYEISNFSQPGFQSRHNSNYWNGKKYIGIGPSAHSYDGKNRSWNKANNSIYLKKIEQNELPSEFEELSIREQFNELLMIRLRRMEGLDLNEISTHFPKEFLDDLHKEIQPYIQQNSMSLTNNTLKITKKALFLSDGIISNLFRID
ncbi:MAG: radical SAM family heme chaperone HemW [Weeksellaceae bacterium]|nr:radical SAM family heme chaperone HemW [Weeksellaceae bacterium]